jgi:hypothetical protein
MAGIETTISRALSAYSVVKFDGVEDLFMVVEDKASKSLSFIREDGELVSTGLILPNRYKLEKMINVETLDSYSENNYDFSAELMWGPFAWANRDGLEPVRFLRVNREWKALGNEYKYIGAYDTAGLGIIVKDDKTNNLQIFESGSVRWLEGYYPFGAAAVLNINAMIVKCSEYGTEEYIGLTEERSLTGFQAMFQVYRNSEGCVIQHNECREGNAYYRKIIDKVMDGDYNREWHEMRKGVLYITSRDNVACIEIHKVSENSV